MEPSPTDWLVFASAAAFVAMGIDKLLARGGRSRVKERTLWVLSLVGGFGGVLVGGLVFHHKTSKAGFWPPVLASAALWLALLWYFPSFLSLR